MADVVDAVSISNKRFVFVYFHVVSSADAAVGVAGAAEIEHEVELIDESPPHSVCV